MRRSLKLLLVGAGVLLLAGLGVTLLREDAPEVTPARPPGEPVAAVAPTVPGGTAPSATTSVARPSPPPVPEPTDTELEELAASLKQRYGKNLNEPHAQIRLIEDLMRFFQQRYPDRWREELLAFLKVHFPEHYDTLAAMLRNREDYEKWVRDNDHYLKGLSEQERRAAIRDARNRLFGKDVADRIWAAELKNQAIGDTLRSLDSLQGKSVEEKLSTFKQRLQEVHGEQLGAVLERHQQELMNRFLDVSSVQTDLGAMSAEERSRNLRAIRREMGLDDEALKRWDTLDQSRDARWDAGLKYMAERQALAKELSGEVLEARLTEIRARYFGAEAESIGQEEASGFFRFERPRRWGRN
ncbi:hypothetical protein ACN47A_31015 [Myxococcus fulvus]|uniref:hypothetical protein n=1 Tax=Myxococcus fulvus TaxID=33 RepID=UPI003B9A49C0